MDEPSKRMAEHNNMIDELGDNQRQKNTTKSDSCTHSKKFKINEAALDLESSIKDGHSFQKEAGDENNSEELTSESLDSGNNQLPGLNVHNNALSMKGPSLSAQIYQASKDTTKRLSAFMARQQEKSHITGLSPIEEMRLAQNELRAQAAAQITTGNQKLRGSFQKLITTKDMLMKLRRPHSVAPEQHALDETNFSIHSGEDDEEREAAVRLVRDMDDLTPAEALEFASYASRDASMIARRQQLHEESTIPIYLISPYGKFRLRWDICSVCLISFSAISIPFQLSFGSDIDFEKGWTSVLQNLISAFYILDIVANFFSAYDDNGHVVVELRVIAKRYLSTWFILDLVSAFPTYLFETSYSRLPQLTRLFRLFRLVRLFRMITILRILNRLEYALILRSTVSSIVKFCFLVCITSHWLCCGFYHISDGDEQGWIAYHELNDASLFARYVTSFYWAIMTMTTVGYGDIHAVSTRERIFAIFAMIIGAWIFAYGITNVVAMVGHLNKQDAEFELKMDELNDYMAVRQLPVELRYEIREFYFNTRSTTESKLSNEPRILAELSALLRSRIAYAVNDSVLNKMPFFAGADHNFLMELALCMRMVCFPSFEEIILEGEVGEEMFFIFRGVVQVYKGANHLGLLGKKQYFGEMAILNQNCLRTASVRTLTFCELRMLTREKFLVALSHYPTMKNRIAKIVEKRTKQALLRQQVGSKSGSAKSSGGGVTTASDIVSKPLRTLSARLAAKLRAHSIDDDDNRITENEELASSESISPPKQRYSHSTDNGGSSVFNSEDTIAASIRQNIDKQTATVASTSAPQTTLSRISQLTSKVDASSRRIMAETDLDVIDMTLRQLREKQAHVSKMIDDLEKKMAFENSKSL